MQKAKFRITQTLLGSWLWSYKTEGGFDDFLKTLRREKMQPTKAMLEGVRFENIVNACLDGQKLDLDHEWAEPIKQLLPELEGAQKQVTLFRDITVGGVPFLLHGVLDFLKCGIIYDTKFSKTYKMNKYLWSPQHGMYFALVPEAYEFKYKICDGKYIYTETYRPDDTIPIEKTIAEFMDFLDRFGLIDIYCDNWKTNN